MITQLRDKRVIFCDVGYTLDAPASGDWMFTNRFLELAGERLKARSEAAVLEAKEAGLRYLAGNHLVTTVEAEEEQFFRYYSIISDELALGLSGTLLNCIKGKVKQVAADNAATPVLKDDGKNYVITMTVDKKSSKGYSKIIVTYRKSDCVLVKMVTESDAGLVNTYTISDILTSVTNKPEVFAPRRG